MILSLNELQNHANELIQQLLDFKPFRRGSLTAPYHKYGKNYYHYSREDDPGHEPI